MHLYRRPLGYEPGRPSRQPSDLSEKRSRRPSVAYPRCHRPSFRVFRDGVGAKREQETCWVFPKVDLENPDSGSTLKGLRGWWPERVTIAFGTCHGFP